MTKLLTSFRGFPLILRQCLKTKNFSFNWSYCQSLRMCSHMKTMPSKDVQYIDSEYEKLLSDQSYEELYPRNWRTIGRKEGVLLVMPRQKWGNKQMSVNYAKHLMNETIALINTLPDMKVIDSLMVSTLDINTRYLFGSGNFQLLKTTVESNPKISAVVFALNMLTSSQTSELESQLGVDIYDRYSIVLNIFRSQAKTKEAKLQIFLAEIPYIRNNLRSLEKNGRSRQMFSLSGVGGSGQTWIETRKQLLSDREIKLKKLLEKIVSNREVLRLNRQRNQIPVIAVIGYTNCGKTSLIKALTDDQRLVPRNQLFATLDVTVHSGRLPLCGLKVLYTDTIGFISEIPTTLIHSFKSTLSEICLADAIVHVLDVSHPNHSLQKETVIKTLDDIEVPERLKNSIIEVENKIDLIDDSVVSDHSDDGNRLRISATKRIGLDQLMDRIEKCVITNTGRLEKTLRVSNGGPEYQWLYRESAIRESVVDPKDHNFLIINIYITFQSFQKFKHIFGSNCCFDYEFN